MKEENISINIFFVFLVFFFRAVSLSDARLTAIADRPDAQIIARAFVERSDRRCGRDNEYVNVTVHAEARRRGALHYKRDVFINLR